MDTAIRRVDEQLADYLDAGKPSWLLDHGASKAVKGHLPAVLRPDLMVTGDGFALVEMDAVPGGIGLTAFLEELYLGEDANGMPSAFHAALSTLVPDNDNQLLVVGHQGDIDTAAVGKFCKSLKTQFR